MALPVFAFATDSPTIASPHFQLLFHLVLY